MRESGDLRVYGGVRIFGVGARPRVVEKLSDCARVRCKWVGGFLGEVSGRPKHYFTEVSTLTVMFAERSAIKSFSVWVFM